MTATENPFPPEALAANKSGRLTDDQVRRLRASARHYHGKELSIAFVLGAAGFASVAVSGHARSGSSFFLVGVVCLVVAAILGIRSVTGQDALTRDLRDVQVESVEGAVLKRSTTYSNGAYSGTTYWLNVMGRKFKVDASIYRATPEAGYVRLYFLRKSCRVVNLERLPDRPVPKGTSPRSLVRDTFRGLLSGNTAMLAETGATVKSFVDSVNEGAGPAGMRPRQESLDPRPLAEAILGTWSSPMLQISFTPGGTATAATPGGSRRSAHWVAGADGTLRTDILGREVVFTAWVADEQLTMSREGKTLVFKRESEFTPRFS